MKKYKIPGLIPGITKNPIIKNIFLEYQGITQILLNFFLILISTIT